LPGDTYLAYLRYFFPVLGLASILIAYADWRTGGLGGATFIPIAAAFLWLIYQGIIVGGWVKELRADALIRAKSYLLLLICLYFALAFLTFIVSPENQSQSARAFGAAFGGSILPALGLVYLIRSQAVQMQFSTAAGIEVAANAGKSSSWSTAFWFPLIAIIAAVLGAGFLANTQGSRTPATVNAQDVLFDNVTDRAVPEPLFKTDKEKIEWLTEMSRRLEYQIPVKEERIAFLKTVRYEAERAALDPHLILALIEVSSGFKKYAVSEAGARGYMQVSPAWVAQIGGKGDNLFHLRTNLRFGCIIFRHYLDTADGNIFRALAAYRNQMLARDETAAPDDFPDQVRRIWETKWVWKYSAPSPSN
jgi:soluble lytic murein transglycosylase-like protein